MHTLDRAADMLLVPRNAALRAVPARDTLAAIATFDGIYMTSYGVLFLSQRDTYFVFYARIGAAGSYGEFPG